MRSGKRGQSKHRKLAVVSNDDNPQVLADQRYEAARIVLKRQRQMHSMNISIGECAACPLKKRCLFVNDEDVTCRMTQVSFAEMMQHARRSPWIQDEDMPGIRSLAAVYASMMIAELHFQIYGSVSATNGKLQFNNMHRQYIGMQKQLLEGLREYGLTPIGRQHLKSMVKKDEKDDSLLSRYVKAQYVVKDAEVTSKLLSDEEKEVQEKKDETECLEMVKTMDYVPKFLAEMQPKDGPEKSD